MPVTKIYCVWKDCIAEAIVGVVYRTKPHKYFCATHFQQYLELVGSGLDPADTYHIGGPFDKWTGFGNSADSSASTTS